MVDKKRTPWGMLLCILLLMCLGTYFLCGLYQLDGVTIENVQENKGDLLRKHGNYLKANGVTVKSFNLINTEESDRYNPMAYLEKETDVIRLITNMQVSVKPPDSAKGDPFWDDGVALYLQAMFFHEWLQAKEEDRQPTLNNILKLVNMETKKVLQSISQIKAIFPNEKWEISLDNCATVVYLGSGPASFSTHEYISKLLGEMTIDTRTDGVTTGAHGNSSRNNAKAGRGLMTPGEVRRMSRKNCILFIEGQYPIFDKKAIPFNTPRWKESEQLAGKEGYKHPVQVVYNKKTMTYKTLQPKADIQFLEKAELQFYKEAEIMELAQRVKQQTKELQDGMSVVEQHEQEGDPQDWNLSGTLCECIIRYADRLSEEQLNEILLGMENGLSEEQVKSYFGFSSVQMSKYRRVYQFNKYSLVYRV